MFSRACAPSSKAFRTMETLFTLDYYLLFPRTIFKRILTWLSRMESLANRIVALAAPCYVANATPVVVAKVVKRTHPIDRGLRFPDGRRILGDGKSVEGFISGILSGTAIGFALKQTGLLGVQEAFVLSLGTMLGDVLGSFVKRRLGIERGDPAPLLDQLAFLLVALLLYLSLIHI